MTRRPLTEKLSTSLRRQRQIQQYAKQALDPSIKKDSSPSAQSLIPPQRKEAEVVSVAESARNCLIGVQNVKHGFGLSWEYEDGVQREAVRAVMNATTTQEATEAFLLLARSTDGKVNRRLVSVVCTQMVMLQTKKLMGDEKYNQITREATGTEERWKGLTREEESILARFHCRELSRYAEKGGAFDPELGRTVEGSDNHHVGKLIHSIKKSVGSSLTHLPLSSLMDLMHLDISWGVSLQIYKESLQAYNGASPIEMTDRVMALMTGYKSNGIGSRPWETALKLYDRAMNSGYSSTLSLHTHALDALWRSGDSFHRKHAQLSAEHRSRVWKMLQQIRNNVKNLELEVSGNEGCAYMESLVKATATAGRWDAAMSILNQMALSVEDTSFRLLVPTPETFLFAIAACYSVGHVTQANAVKKIFDAHYCLKDVHSEVLLVFLQSLRHALRFPNKKAGTLVEELVEHCVLTRPCVVACLQLLSNTNVLTGEPKEKLALRLFYLYDNTLWLQEPLARQVELNTVFRCCYLIAEKTAGAASSSLLEAVKSRVVSVFGTGSPEECWLNDTALYSLFHTSSWKHALEIYERYHSRCAKDIPVPLFQLKQGFIDALLRCCKTLSFRSTYGDDAPFFLDEEERQQKSEEIVFIAQLALTMARKIFPLGDALQDTLGELYLIAATHTPLSKEKQRKTLITKCLWHFSLGPQSSLTRSHITRIADAAGLTEENVEASLLEGHATMRFASLRRGVTPTENPLLNTDAW